MGIFFGIVMTKSEVISWYRIYEMFHFANFHMFGVIGVAVVLGIIQLKLINKMKMKDVNGEAIYIKDKESFKYRYILGGIVFGLGWALVGACPGPMFTLLGHGFIAMIIVIFSSIFGTFVYGLLRDNLPH